MVNVFQVHLRSATRTRRLVRAPSKSGPRWLTHVADIARAGVMCAAVSFLAVGDGSTAFKALLVLVATLAGRLPGVHPAFDLLFTLALAAEAVGPNLGAHHSVTWGDTVSHIVLPLLSGPVVYGVLTTLGATPRSRVARASRARLRAAVLTTLVIMSLGVMWELVEWAADSALSTDYSQGRADTLRDLRNDAIAAAGAGLLVTVWLSAVSIPRTVRLWAHRS